MSDPLSDTLNHLSALRDNLRKSAQVKAAAAIPAELLQATSAPPQGAPAGDPSAQPGLLDPGAGGGQPAPVLPPEAPSQEPPITRAEIQDMLRQAMQQQPGAAPVAAAPAAGGGKGGGAKQEQEKRLAQLEVAVSQLLKATGLGSPEQAIEEGLQEHATQAEAVLQQSQPPAAPGAAQGGAPGAAPQAAPSAGPAGYGPGSGQASGIPAGGMKAAASPVAALARRLRGR